jgi:hypothetical protein
MASLRINSSDRITPEEVNIALGDLYTTPLPVITKNDTYTVIVFIFVVIMAAFSVVFILDHLLSKYRNVTNIQEKDNTTPSITNKEVTRISNSKNKAKESPFIDYSISIPPTQPTFYKLDKAEKGQNISLNYRLPYRRNIESDMKGHETKITILVQENNSDMLASE